MNPLLRTTTLAAVMLSSVAFGQNRVFTSQYSFGDSLSDNGNVYILSQRTQPPAPYYNGRFSNGPVFTELLGNTIVPAVTVPTGQRANLNFAYGGATAGSGGAVPNFALQIAQYKQQGLAPGRNDLFTVLFGANDMISVLSAPTTPANPAVLDSTGAAVAQTVAAGVQSLVTLGAKNLLVAGLPNLGATPRSLASGGVGGPGAVFGARASTAFNNELRARLGGIAAAAADVNVTYIDVQGIIDRVALDYQALGFKTASTYFLAPAAQGGGAGDPNSYVFWDDIHPTAHTHQIMAAIATEALNPEPVIGFSATTGAAALALRGLADSAIDGRVAQLATVKRAAGRADVYASYTYGDGVRAADGLRPRFNHTAQVVTAGADLGFGSSFLLGGAVESGRLSAKVAAGAGNFAVEDNGGRLYGVWQGGPASLVVDAGYGVIGLKGIHRTTAFGGFQTNGKGSGTHWGAGLKAAWSLDRDGITLRPWAGLRTERVSLAARSESDVPSLSMDFDAQQVRSSAGSVGVDVGQSFKTTAGTVRLDLRGAWHGELGSSNRTVSGKLANNFTRTTAIQVADGDGSGVELGGAATLIFSKNWSASLGYYGDIRSGEKLASRAVFSIQTGF
jgi:outer membrane lipase/esterase